MVTLRARPFVIGCALAAAPACASVDPGPDYDRLSESVRRATGAETVYHPDVEPQELDARVDELLEDGVTLDEAVEIGLCNGPLLRASFREVGIASANHAQAGLFTNPSLDAVLRFPTSGGGTAIEGGLFTSLLDLWQVPDRERVARHALEERIERVAHEAVLVSGEVRGAWLQAYATRRMLEIAERNREVAAELVRLAEARLEARAATVIDANLARLERGSTMVALRDAELAAEEAMLRLRALLGLLPDRPLRLAALPELAPRELPPAPELERIALAARLDVRAAQAGLARAEAELERQRELVLRNLDVGVGAEKGDEWSIGPGARLELPLFDRNQAQIAKAREHTYQREQLLRATILAASSEVRQAHARVRAAFDTLALQREEILDRAEETLEQARNGYRAGKTTILPVIEAQRTLLHARRAYIERTEQVARALSEVETTTGTPLEILFEGDRQGEPKR